jgi:hypothetical protein
VTSKVGGRWFAGGYLPERKIVTGLGEIEVRQPRAP